MAQYNIVIAGCGEVAPNWLDYTLKRPDCSIVGLVDTRAEAAAALADRYRLQCPRFTALAPALAQCRPNLVYDLTVPAAHCETTTAALEAGCDVLAEKPMSNSLESAERMVKTAVEAGKSYSLMHQRRFQRGIQDLRAFLQSGRVGQPGFLCADFFLGPHYFGGFKETMESPLLIDMSIHTLDMARFILGAEPVSVYCQEFNPAGSWFRDNSSAVAIYEMSDGSTFCYRGSWSAEGFQTSWEADWRLQCSGGTILWNGCDRPVAQAPAPSDTPLFLNTFEDVEVPAAYRGAEGYEGCLDEMFRALAEKRPAETDCRDNIHSVRMLFAAVRSSREGRKVRISDLLKATGEGAR